MTNRPKQIGTAAESAVVRAARTRGFPMAERIVLHGSIDHGDIRLTPGLTAGIILEVKGGEAAKNASDAQIDAWLKETETERANADADHAFLVTARRGVGPANAHRWWAWIHLTWLEELLGAHTMTVHPRIPVRIRLDHALTLLREAGYGDPVDDQEIQP